jgi:hypothetical protein
VGVRAGVRAGGRARVRECVIVYVSTVNLFIINVCFIKQVFISNGIWFVAPGLGMYVSYHLIMQGAPALALVRCVRESARDTHERQREREREREEREREDR